MAITSCKECGGKISTEAPACPHCGFSKPVVANPEKSGSSGLSRASWALIIVAVVAWTISTHKSDDAPDSNAQPKAAIQPAITPSCKSDWRLCSNNADLANNWNGYYKVQADCKLAALKIAKYGTPEFPWGPFSRFVKGDSSPKTGLVEAYEPDAKFSNGFGAMVHTGVSCKYDLNTEKVLDVRIDGS